MRFDQLAFWSTPTAFNNTMALLHAIVANNEHVLAEASSPDLQSDPEAGNTFSSAVSKAGWQ